MARAAERNRADEVGHLKKTLDEARAREAGITRDLVSSRNALANANARIAALSADLEQQASSHQHALTCALPCLAFQLASVALMVAKVPQI